ncbi:hypothetical protein BaRGS_00011254 [Batillaria attramentaria]|uniref:Uncharacterized protein n=1 Tax=Batillaria attramentaria TaxID=370345 RepID=A0ABD0LDS2_9CAEN
MLVSPLAPRAHAPRSGSVYFRFSKMATTEFDFATILEEPDEFDDTEASTSSQHQSQLKHISRELLAEVFQSLTENQCLTEESQKAIQDIAGKLDSHEKLTFLQTCLVPRGRFSECQTKAPY